ncbi:cation/H(+) antiporter 15-like isoform X1 [Nicotiana tabacum]|uniref:Cation/H(+) antiporter 15-like isoform X1 n=2 Tax=Nicotiana tabacum TaxID=4097 RepID=A0A1S4BYI9_TOBAC|nr:PREDICTED: cation/H(+) antiporter 15-like isoform X1 [Nicotiana tabacum]
MADLEPPIDTEKLNEKILCYAQTIYRLNGVWEGPDPLTPIIPLFFVQISLAILITRLVMFALKITRQPPFVAEIISGILLGPSALGQIVKYRRQLFPNYNFHVIETMAHVALVFYGFLVGLQMDIKSVLRIGIKARNVAVIGIIIPFVMGTILFFSLYRDEDARGFIFYGGALTVTGFSVLAKILDKQKILQTDIGKMAMSSAVINDIGAWFILALGYVVTGSTTNIHWAVICTIAYALFCVFYLRRAIGWIIRKMPEVQGYSEFFVCSILAGMAISGVITDALGTHPIIGAFLFGLSVPNQMLQAAILDKLDDFVMGFLMPTFFVVCGLRTNFKAMGSIYEIVGYIILFVSAKILSTFAATFFSDMSIKEALAVGILSNTKSLMALIIIEAGQAQQILNTQLYSLMVTGILVMTVIVTPITMLYHPSQELAPHKRRTIQKAKVEEELRVLACIHAAHDIPSVINLLGSSNSTPAAPITVFALQVVELVGRASSMLEVHTSGKRGSRSLGHEEAQTRQIIAAFDNYELRSDGVMVQVLTARCALSTMDEDICNIAKDKRAAFIILPFHKQRSLAGEMEDVNPEIRAVNEGVLANAPCSVGILIDRGLSETSDYAKNIVVLYFGGPDDREALGYALRMVDRPDTRLTVVKFIPGEDATDIEPMEFAEESHVNVHIDKESENLLDEEFLNRFKISTANDKSVKYIELLLNDVEEAVKAIKLMDQHSYDLYIVGKGRGIVSPLTAGLVDWCDCPELGAIGDLLVTSEFDSTFSVLVMQQYVKPIGDGSVNSYGSMSERIGLGMDMDMDMQRADSEAGDVFSSFRRRPEHMPRV